MKIKNVIKKYPAISYFILTFLISWGGSLFFIAPGGIPGTTEQVEQWFSLALMILLIGPLLSGLILTGMVHGKTGFRDLFSRMFKWKVPIIWYIIALLVLPVLVFGILMIMSQFSDIYLPAILTTTQNPWILLISGIGVGIMGGLFEEIGWTGFALPEMRKKLGVFSSGIILGIIWGVWHLLITFWASGDATGNFEAELFFAPFVFYMLILPVFRLLMVWVYDRTKSMLISILMHTSLIFSTLFVLQPAAQGTELILFYLVLGGVLLLAVIIIALTKGWKITGQKTKQKI